MSSYARRSIIQTCRDHHAVLLDLLKSVQVEFGQDAQRAHAGLERVTTVLLRHLELEDGHLYPALEGLPDHAVADKARRYREEMGGLFAQFVAFAARWNEPAAIAAAPREFAEHWAQVRAALEQRIAAEDGDLYEVAERVLTI